MIGAGLAGADLFVLERTGATGRSRSTWTG
jgi:hypothetical protein